MEDLSSFVVDSIGRLCQYKLKRIDAIYESYDAILKYFEKLKSFLEEKMKYRKLFHIINYKSISVTDKINDDDIVKIRNLYLEKVIEN